ncbi:MAG: sulfite exporter TauE/SafE family protein, partial [Myxococcota bacterium]
MGELLVAAAVALPIGVMIGLLGGGGSILTVPLLVYGLHFEDKEAIATSLLVVMVTSVAAAIPYARARLVRWRVALIFAASAMTGAFSGGQVAQFIPGSILLLLFASMMLITSVAMWRGRKPRPALKEELSDTSASVEQARRKKLWLVIPQGLLVGFFTGLVGAGGGFLVVPALVLLGRLEPRQAVGTSLVVVSANSFAGFLGYVSHVEVNYTIAGALVGAAVVGSFIGAALSKAVPQPKLRRGFAVFVAVMGAYILIREIPA